jgi:methyl-accepting chemotaxis protein
MLGICAGSIGQPVKKMVTVADKLALGEINIDLDIDTEDEIGTLAKSFGVLIESTKEQALAVERIASGDLTAEVRVRSKNDVLGSKLSELLEKLNDDFANIASAADQVASGAKQISNSSMELSQGATEQASSIQELTASLEELSSQTKLNAENADKANQFTENAKANAENGNIQMKEMLKAMDDISVSSRNISKIIKVIDDIAFQTNILALNAAVEAARAGQHGKGFAVVAEEVRTLAARSANAAKETTDMIEGSIRKVEDGTKIAKDTADALDKIVNEVDRAAALVSEIAVASNEQASGIAQINQGIMQVSQVVQTNSANSEEGAAASEELSGQAELMKDLVGKFRLKRVNKSYIVKGNHDESAPANEDHGKSYAKGIKNIVLSDMEFGKY